MKNYKILRCGDQDFWAYAFLAKEHIKYSKHNMEYVCYNKVHYDTDLLYIHSPDITNAHATTIPKIAHSKGIKVIGAYAGSPVFWSPAEKRIYDYSDLIVTISPQTYEFAKFHYKNHPIIFLPESVDTDVFYPNYEKIYNTKKKDLVIGWAGGAHKKIKRTYLLDKLDFPVKIKSDWQQQRNNKITTNNHMVDFYQSLDVLVVTSITECMPRVILEAMACGIPVISTDCGGIRMLIDREFLVPVNPEDDCVSQINTRLHMLYKYPELRKAIGLRNRKWIEEQWSWEKNTTLWDEVFSLVIEDKVNKAIILADKYLNKYKKDFDYLRNRFRKVYFNPIKKPKVKKPASVKILPKLPILSSKKQALDNLIATGIRYWLLKKTCLECIIYDGEKLTSSLITIGVNNIIDATNLIGKLGQMGYNNLSKNEINIEIVVDPNRKTKAMVLLGTQVLVPIPVISYLNIEFGRNWENLK